MFNLLEGFDIYICGGAHSFPVFGMRKPQPSNELCVTVELAVEFVSNFGSSLDKAHLLVPFTFRGS